MDDHANLPDPSDQQFVPVCAIGASAGGVTALQDLFRLIPADLGLAYVVILHLTPDQPSALGEILAACTRMPVVQVEDGPTLARNTIYVIPPDRELVIEGDNVMARAFSEPRGRRAPIDVFFRSIAAARGDGVAIVLSGAGSDGSIGVRAIKEAGGVIMVQQPAEAPFESMPQSAIKTGVADIVAPIARLAERLAEVARSKEAVRSLDMDGNANELRRIVAFLRARTGHDFAGYKRATVMRRVTRRMAVCHAGTLPDYADYLLATPDEIKELLSDLLISVTSFFRDPRAFDILEQRAIKQIFDRIDPERDGIRVWVVGCATGEEAYSVAILLHEEAHRRKMFPKIQVIASDLDEGALATAREGRYPRTIEADVSEARLARFFKDEGTHYRVCKELRENLLFASHSVIKDPPFLRLDLVTCRNLLIYLERSLQQELCSLFHYALRPGRYLFLGSAETADAAPDTFALLDRDARIYSARPHTGRKLPVVPSFGASERLAQADLLKLSAPARINLPIMLHSAALERSSPASALVDDAHNIVHLSPSAGRFILHSAGPVSNALPAIVRPELRLDLKIALSRAIEQKQPTLTLATAVAFDGERRRVAMQIVPVIPPEQAGGHALVFFLDGGSLPGDIGADAASDERSEEARRLQAELKASQEALVTSQTGQESAIQDLRATNEELQSINEEYRSTAEELETSREELQSINEELHTVNAELKSKLASISIAHSDLQNLTAATEIGTLFLDPDLRIKMFTPPIAEFFNITQVDVGRSVADFTNRLHYDGIEQDVRRVLRELVPVEREIRSIDGRWFMMRLRPYRTVEDRIDGTVVTFVDISARVQAEAALSRSEQQLRALVRASSQVMYRMSPAWNEMRELVGGGFLSNTETPDESWLDRYIPSEDQPQVRAMIQEAVETQGSFNLEHRIRRLDGTVGWTHSRAVPILNEAGEVIEWFGSASDVTPRKHAETSLRASEARQRALIEGVPQLVWRANPKGHWTWASPQWTAFTGQPEPDSHGMGWAACLHPDDRSRASAQWQEAEQTGVLAIEYRIRHAATDQYRWFQTRGTPVRDEDGNIAEWLSTSTDVDDLRAMQERQEVMVSELQHRTRNLLGVVCSIAAQTVRSCKTLQDFEPAFNGRLAALSRVQGLLSRSEDEPITVDALIRSELDALGAAEMPERVVTQGPEVRLRKATVQTLALALHELATNARKYGALSNDCGQLRTTWHMVTEGTVRRLVLEWHETGFERRHQDQGDAPATGGYGRTLIERALPYVLKARTSYTLGDTTLHCTIDLPLAEVADPTDLLH